MEKLKHKIYVQVVDGNSLPGEVLKASGNISHRDVSISSNEPFNGCMLLVFIMKIRQRVFMLL